jgi:hypothetical protein
MRACAAFVLRWNTLPNAFTYGRLRPFFNVATITNPPSSNARAGFATSGFEVAFDTTRSQLQDCQLRELYSIN